MVGKIGIGESRQNVIAKCCNSSEIFNAKSNSCENGNFSLRGELTFFKLFDGNPIKKFVSNMSLFISKKNSAMCNAIYFNLKLSNALLCYYPLMLFGPLKGLIGPLNHQTDLKSGHDYDS